MAEYGWFFRANRFIVRRAIGRDKTVNMDKIQHPAIYVGHHQNMYGPVHTMASFPAFIRPWGLGVFLDGKTASRHFCEFTFRERLGWGRLRTSIAAPIGGHYVAALLRSGRAIPVYRQSRRLLETMDLSLDALVKGESIAVFPDVEYDEKSPQLDEIYSGFLKLEKVYHRKTGKHIPFIPLYCSKKQRSIYVGDAIYFEDGQPFGEEKTRVMAALVESINEIGRKAGDIAAEDEKSHL